MCNVRNSKKMAAISVSLAWGGERVAWSDLVPLATL